MKKLILNLIIFLIANFSISYSQSLRPLNYSFKGVIIYNNNLIAYGTGGAYMVSTDNGTTWEINRIDKLDSIFYVVYSDGYFFVRDKNSINVIDKNFNIISTYKDQMLS